MAARGKSSLGDDVVIALIREMGELSGRFDLFVEAQLRLNDGLKRTLYGQEGTNGIQGSVRDLKGMVAILSKDHGELTATVESIQKRPGERRQFYWREFFLKTLLPALAAVVLERLLASYFHLT